MTDDLDYDDVRESGPFCGVHWEELPCEKECKRCEHLCGFHRNQLGKDPPCGWTEDNGEGCECEGWVE